MIGNVERLEDKIRMSHELKARGFYNYEIADAIAERYGCDRPDPSTVSNWLAAHRNAANEDIREFINEARLYHFKFLQEQLRKWHAITMSKRFSRDEQMKALFAFLKIMERQARLLGLDLPQAKTEGEATAWEQMQYLERMHREIKFTDEGMHFPNGVVLEFRSGIEVLDDLDGPPEQRDATSI